MSYLKVLIDISKRGDYMVEMKSGTYALSIVAVVALVGLTTMFMRGGTGSGAASDELLISEGGEYYGEAIKLPQRRTLVSELKDARAMVRAALCRDSDGGVNLVQAGTVTSKDVATIGTQTDHCDVDGRLEEWSCDSYGMSVGLGYSCERLFGKSFRCIEGPDGAYCGTR